MIVFDWIGFQWFGFDWVCVIGLDLLRLASNGWVLIGLDVVWFDWIVLGVL